MAGFLITWSLNIVCLVVVSFMIPGISVDTWQTLVLAGLALGFVNAVLRPVILLFTLPFTIASLGILTLFINGMLFYGVSKAVPGFAVSSFASAFWGALVFSIVSFTLNLFINPRGRFTVQYYRSNSLRTRKRYRDVIDVKARSEDKQRLRKDQKER